MRIAEARVLITGGTSGIGLSLGRMLAAKGARVWVCGRSEEKLCEAQRFGLTAISADVATASGRSRVVGTLREAGGLDILVNNAGTQALIDFRQSPCPEVIHEEIAVNLEAPILLAASALPMLLDRRPDQADALIVNVTSGLALAPKMSAPVYCATKAGLRSFTLALRYQLEGTSVRVMEALPPLVDTAMTQGRGRGKITPEACAAQILSGIECGDEEVLVGKTRLLRLVLRILPSLAHRIMKRW